MVTNNCINQSGAGYVSYDGAGGFNARSWTKSNGLNILIPDGTSGNTDVILHNWRLESTQVASDDATIEFTSLNFPGYRSYVLVWRDVTPETNASSLTIEFSNNGGSSWTTAAEGGLCGNDYDSSTYLNYNSSSAGLLTPPLSTAASTQLACGVLYVDLFGSNKTVCYGRWSAYNQATSKAGFGTINVYQAQNGNNSFRVLMDADNIATGTFSVFGIQR